MTYREIAGPVIDQMLEETAATMPDIPSDLNKTYAKYGRWGGFSTGVGLGAHIGAGLGIAGGPLGAIAGTIPGAILGGVIGYFSGEKLGGAVNDEK
jgi:hypothetical protein